MILGFHLTWTTYGHWFPNDPRGSWSDEVWKPELLDLRCLDDERKVTHPRPVNPEKLREFMDSARDSLKCEPVYLPEDEIRGVGRAFTEVVERTDLPIHACAILRNHVHVITGRHPTPYERVVDRLKGRASQRVREQRGIPVAIDRKERVPIWTQRYWVRYIDDTEQMSNAIRYVRRNRDQDWEFVRTFVP